MTATSPNPFRLNTLNNLLAKPLERILGLNPLAEGYEKRPLNASPAQFLSYTLEALGCDTEFDGVSLRDAIPESGPVIIFANHPFGGLEGVALAKELLKIRPDTKVLTNEMLSRIPELAPIFFGVDVLSDNATRKNMHSIRAVDRHLQEKGLLLIFPAGQVSNARWKNLQVSDREWNNMVGRLASKHEATCVPVYVHGQNPLYFQLGGLIHRRIRTALLPRQLANKAGKKIRMTAGSSIKPVDYRSLSSAQAITNFFRMSTYLLGKIDNAKRERPISTESEFLPDNNNEALLNELLSVADCKLLSKAEFDVYCAPFDRLNLIFDAIAQAREATFRAVGEGTGKNRDTDKFDPHYLHLFVWDREKQQIVGGYRLGETQKIVQAQGISALYSRSLYHYDEKYVKALGNALEVGRSFVTLDYQRHPSALDLLWRGIGRFVAKHPDYDTLFGCVSISSSHSEIARAFISDAMMESFRAEQKFLERVKPIFPLRVKGKVWSRGMLKSIQDVSLFNKLVGQCDPGKTIPVLLRHYLALNGRFIGFAINKGFNNALDGLIIVDIHRVPERYATRYLGKDGLKEYQRYWKHNESTVQREYRGAETA